MINKKYGFTLIELLIAMLLIGIVMSVLVSFFGQTTKISAQSNARSELQQETLNAQQLMAARLREAWYIFPAGQQITLGGAVKNPATKNNIWRLGTDPVLALVLPPKKKGGTCNTVSEPDYCYRFYAYYAVPRSDWASNSGISELDKPRKDTANANTWVLVEYRSYYKNDVAAGTGPVSLNAPIGSDVDVKRDASLLAEYIRPTTQLFQIHDTKSNLSRGSASGIAMKLSVYRKMGRKTIIAPSTGTYDLNTYPTNLEKVAYDLNVTW